MPEVEELLLKDVIPSNVSALPKESLTCCSGAEPLLAENERFGGLNVSKEPSLLKWIVPVFSSNGAVVSIVAGPGTEILIAHVLPVAVSSAVFLNSILIVCLEPKESNISIELE
ncbi:MAG: hypothetical protein SPLUMA1_SPLUMAMAG1_01943 [uncultured Sulfurimonas sp.]|nr:MAG: hypothetical protein SPLUMA1_SPLUMAMAG1_01943 [uncultured Sulfurimonas sp.]